MTPERLIEVYSKAGLVEVAEKIVQAFKDAENRFDNVRLYPTRKYLNLRIFINHKRIDVSVKGDPNGDHGVWTSSELYQAVKDVGNKLGFKTRIPSTDSGKIIEFNGIDGIKSAVDKLDKLIEELANVRTPSW